MPHVQTHKLSTLENTILEDTLLKLGENPQPLHFDIEPLNNPQVLQKLTTWIETTKPPLFKLSLSVNKALLATPEFGDLIASLAKHSPDVLSLALPVDELSDSIAIDKLLADTIAPKADFPIILTNAANKDRVLMPSFEAKIIEAMQKSGKGFNQSEGVLSPEADAKSDDPAEAKIRLKALIKPSNATDDLYKQYTAVEIEHTEEQVTEQKIEEAINQEQEIAQFQGELIDYAKFNTAQYRNIARASLFRDDQIEQAFKLAKTELFANLPHGIKYLSADAARKLAAKLPHWVACNKERLTGFLLKKTDKGEYVLDCDPEADPSDEHHLLSPQDYEPYFEKEPYYKIAFSKQQLDSCIGHPAIQARLAEEGNRPLMNLWCRQGDKGLRTFFDNLKALDKNHAGLSDFIYDHYLSQFDHLEPFCNQEFFDEALKKLAGYSQVQIACLKRFLVNTGASRHNLVKTLESFDFFWSRLSEKCKGDEEVIKFIDSDWSTPEGGQPVVYMERLLTIIQNARGDVAEQLKHLKGIKLDSFGAYYASKYEQFTGIHEGMGFNYQPEKYDALPFNPAFQCYRVDFEHLYQSLIKNKKIIDDHSVANFIIDGHPCGWLIDSKDQRISKEQFLALQAQGKVIPYREYALKYDSLPKGYRLYNGKGPTEGCYLNSETLPTTVKKLYELIHCYVGQQLSGITVGSFAEQFKDVNDKGNYSYNEEFHTNFSVAIRLLMALPFITHERFTPTVEGYYSEFDGRDHRTLLVLLENTNFQFQKTVLKTIEQLQHLYSLNIRLSSLEAAYFVTIQHFHCMGEDIPNLGQERLWHTLVEEYPARMYQALLENKYSGMQFLRFVGKHGKDKCSTYAFHTEAFFKAAPGIKTRFPDELLTFSALLKNYNLNLSKDLFQEKLNKAHDPDIEGLKKVRDYLALAANHANPKNYIAETVRLLVDSEQYLSYETAVTLFAEVHKLPFVNNDIDLPALKTVFQKHGLTLKIKVPELFQRDNVQVKNCLITVLLELEVSNLKNKTPEEIQAHRTAKGAEFFSKDIKALQSNLQEQLSKSGMVINALASFALNQALTLLRKHLISEHFTDNTKTSGEIDTTVLMEKFLDYTLALSDMQIDGDIKDNFEKLNRAVGKSAPLAIAFGAIAKHACVLEHQPDFLSIMNAISFAKLDSETVFQLLELITKMPQRNYLPLLKTFVDNGFIYQKDQFLKLMPMVEKLNAKHMSTETMVSFCKRFVNNEANLDFTPFVTELTEALAEDDKDPLMQWLLNAPKLKVREVLTISHDNKYVTVGRDKCTKLYQFLSDKEQLLDFLQETSGLEDKKKTTLITMLARAYATRRRNDPEIKPLEVLNALKALSDENLEALRKLHESTPISIACLHNALQDFKKDSPFKVFLDTIEKAPFGKRDETVLYNCDQLERVINESSDLVNRSAYPYQYRKQMMETFLLVNDMGRCLPVFTGKPAQELSNVEIQEEFLKLKADKNGDPNRRRVAALALMREAMYRSTGEFPYSTQMIVLIDCMMHQGDVISNVDTGQGKSLIDIMKAAFLWLDSDRVDVSTSSLIDAKRDIANYGPFLELLGVPFAKKPISASTPFAEFSNSGVNFSTFSQLSLFFSRALALNHDLSPPNDKVSLVMNESDYAILDDRAIKRFATSEGACLGKGQLWIYTALNKFVTQDGAFMADNTSKKTDIRRLRRFLKNEARAMGKSFKFIFDGTLSDEQLGTWIDSALLVNYKFRENFDYMVLPNGDQVDSYSAKVLTNDFRPSPDSVFGKGIQQLLHAKLNKDKRIVTKTGVDAFEVKVETTTIIAASSENLINFYRAKKGWIWGSSGTVGSQAEVDEQFSKYGFHFSKIEPHQEKVMDENKPVILADEEEQLERLSKEMQAKMKSGNLAPTLIFCKDIEMAKKIHAHLAKTADPKLLQLFTGVGSEEEEVIKKAAIPGMFTVTTSAIGRNTDIGYDKTVGLDIWHTYIASTRLDRQKSGRARRQGSPGVISYFLNKLDQNISSLSDIHALRERLDKEAKIERAFNEELYSVIGPLLRIVEQTPSAKFTKMGKQEFLRKKWSLFSAHMEQEYRELQIAKTYQRDAFVDANRKILLADLQEAIPGYQELPPLPKPRVFEAKPYNPYTKKVTIKDCTPPIVIAHELFYASRPKGAAGLTEEAKEGIKQELGALFSETKDTSLVERNQSFMKVLSASAATQTELRDLYQGFLTEFLEKKKESTFFQRWFGFADHLNQMANNQTYLCLFQVLGAVDKGAVLDLGAFKTLATDMLEEYLQNSWFINSAKKQSAIDLQAAINNSADLNAVLKNLVDSQLAIAEADIESNKNRIIPLHFFHKSRLQDTISNILSLAASLGMATHHDGLVKGLATRLETLTEDVEMKAALQTPSNDTVNTVQDMMSKFSDKSNVRTLIHSMEKALFKGVSKVTAMEERLSPEGPSL